MNRSATGRSVGKVRWEMSSGAGATSASLFHRGSPCTGGPSAQAGEQGQWGNSGDVKVVTPCSLLHPAWLGNWTPWIPCVANRKRHQLQKQAAYVACVTLILECPVHPDSYRGVVFC